MTVNEMSEITLNVKGMKCGGCAKNVENAVGKLPGVGSVRVDLKKGEVKVTTDGSTRTELVKEAITKAGYKVE
jgi:copper ion binding protein